MPKNPAPKKAVKPKVPALYKGPFCAQCQGPMEVSCHAADEGVPKSRCMNEQCPKYGEPVEAPNG